MDRRWMEMDRGERGIRSKMKKIIFYELSHLNNHRLDRVGAVTTNLCPVKWYEENQWKTKQAGGEYKCVIKSVVYPDEQHEATVDPVWDPQRSKIRKLAGEYANNLPEQSETKAEAELRQDRRELVDTLRDLHDFAVIDEHYRYREISEEAFWRAAELLARLEPVVEREKNENPRA